MFYQGAGAQSLCDDSCKHEFFVHRIDAENEPLQIGHAEKAVYSIDRRFFQDDSPDVGGGKITDRN